MNDQTFGPRFIRLRDAPAFLGMDRNRFNAEIRPYLTEITVGVQGRAFDRLELDDIAGGSINPATDVPVDYKENDYGTKKDARSRQERRGLAHRQKDRRATDLQKHWND